MMEEMSSNNDNMTKLCRLCLVTNNTLTSMFTFSSRLGVLTADIVMKCAAIHVIEEDNLPDSICGACYMELERIHQFQTMALESDKALRTRLQQQQAEIQRLENRADEVTVKLENIVENKDSEIQRLEKMADEVTVKLENIIENKDSEIQRTEKMADGVTVKLENIVENKDSYQLNIKEENPGDASDDVKNSSIEEVFKVESDVIIPEEPLNDTEIDTNNEENMINADEESIINDNEEVKFDFLEPDDNSSPEQMESSVPQFDIIEPYNEYQDNKNLLKRNQCPVCKECFKSRYQLLKHQPTHPRKRQRFPCDQCKRVFKLRTRLVFHRFSHEKEQNCDMCEKSFRSRHILNAHKLTHTGETPYRCSLCKKTFKGQSSLKNHMLWHTGDKPHRCRICENQFRHFYNLRLHLSLVHGTQNI